MKTRRLSNAAFHLSICLGAWLLLQPVLRAAEKQTMTPQEILQKMAARYVSLKSYQDTGEVHGELVTTTFKTYFSRPSFFRFDWNDHHPFRLLRYVKYHHVIWSDGKEAFTYWDSPYRVRKAESLGSAVAGATGVSQGSAHTLIRLLTDEVTGFSLIQLTNLSLVGEEKFERTDCYRITGRHPRGYPYELWIGKQDWLLRKIKSDSDEEIHREIKIDIEIPAETFRFKPPKKRRIL